MQCKCGATTLVIGFQMRSHHGRWEAAARRCDRDSFAGPVPGLALGRFFNLVFTRVVNHCVIVVGLKGALGPLDEGLSLFGHYGRVLMLNMRRRLAKKPPSCNILGRFARMRPERMRALESGFVNHASLKF